MRSLAVPKNGNEPRPAKSGSVGQSLSPHGVDDIWFARNAIVLVLESTRIEIEDPPSPMGSGAAREDEEMARGRRCCAATHSGPVRPTPLFLCSSHLIPHVLQPKFRLNSRWDISRLPRIAIVGDGAPLTAPPMIGICGPSGVRDEMGQRGSSTAKNVMGICGHSTESGDEFAAWSD